MGETFLLGGDAELPCGPGPPKPEDAKRHGVRRGAHGVVDRVDSAKLVVAPEGPVASVRVEDPEKFGLAEQVQDGTDVAARVVPSRPPDIQDDASPHVARDDQAPPSGQRVAGILDMPLGGDEGRAVADRSVPRGLTREPVEPVGAAFLISKTSRRPLMAATSANARKCSS